MASQSLMHKKRKTKAINRPNLVNAEYLLSNSKEHACSFKWYSETLQDWKLTSNLPKLVLQWHIYIFYYYLFIIILLILVTEWLSWRMFHWADIEFYWAVQLNVFNRQMFLVPVKVFHTKLSESWHQPRWKKIQLLLYTYYITTGNTDSLNWSSTFSTILKKHSAQRWCIKTYWFLISRLGST